MSDTKSQPGQGLFATTVPLQRKRQTEKIKKKSSKEKEGKNTNEEGNGIS